MAASALQQVYQLHISLNNIEPNIWRRILVPSEITLDILHITIQKVMGWEDEHLHLFIDGNKQYGTHEPDWDELGADHGDESVVQLKQVLSAPDQTLLYEYDFGDSWLHTIKLEEIKSVEEVENSPFCLEGERTCPPENCGGIPGYYNLLEIMADPKHEEYEDTLLWLGSQFDPDAFDLNEINSISDEPYLDEEEELCAQVEAQQIVLNLLFKTLKTKHPDTYELLYQSCIEASNEAREVLGAVSEVEPYAHCLADNIESLFDGDGSDQIH